MTLLDRSAHLLHADRVGRYPWERRHPACTGAVRHPACLCSKQDRLCARREQAGCLCSQGNGSSDKERP